MIGQSISNNGVMLKPWLIDNITLGKKQLYAGEKQKLTRTTDKGTANRLRELMHNTAVDQYGFDNADLYGKSICAKTGTAELGDGTDHIYILTFNDEYVVMCSANNTRGRYGSSLAPWAKDMYKYLKNNPYEYTIN